MTQKKGQITNAATAYFNLPPIWVKGDPISGDVSPRLSPQGLVYERTLTNGLVVKAHADGLFRFNFESWDFAGPVFIPEVELQIGERTPRAVEDATEEARLHV